MPNSERRRTVLDDLPAIIVDSREQTPFDLVGFKTVRRKLDAGDYGLELADGSVAPVAVERKSWNDCWGSMSDGRARFERCVKRLAQLDRAAIVIECSLTRLCDPPHQIQRTTPASVVGGLISWSCQYQIPVFWCDSREFAERVTVRWLASWWKHRLPVL